MRAGEAAQVREAQIQPAKRVAHEIAVPEAPLALEHPPDLDVLHQHAAVGGEQRLELARHRPDRLDVADQAERPQVDV